MLRITMDRHSGHRTPDTGPDTRAESTLTALEAAMRLGVHERTIRRAIARGDLEANKQGGLFRISLEALERFQSDRLGLRAAHDELPDDPLPSLSSLLAAPKLVIVGSELLARPPLPRPLDALIGRENEMAEVQDLLLRPEVRLLTLTGPGGVGKTRLALAVAAAVESAFADGVAFVPLAAISDPGLVLPTIARGVGLRDAGDRPVVDRLGAALLHRQLLLVLDNFEHIAPGSPAVADLLSACPGLAVLVTSREPLRVGGEHRFPLAPLALPSRTERPSATALTDYSAVTLFLDRAARVRPGFALTADNAATISAICARLDGLPLAIELAAAWISSLSPEALLTRLEHRLPLLTGGNRDLPDRQRTMRDTVAWSYDLLSADEQRCFRQLAIFVGGFTLDAAEQVGAPITHRQSPSSITLQLIDALVAKNLLVRVVEPSLGSDAYPRLGMLETIREFGLEQLAASGEGEATRERHIRWCLEFGEDAWRVIWQQPLRIAELDRVESEHDNVRSALGWLIDAGDGERALRLATSLAPFWYLRSHRKEGLAWHRGALSLAAAKPILPHLAARSSYCLGYLSDDVEEVDAALVESLRLSRASGNRWETAASLQALAVVASVNGRHDEATTLGEEALALFESLSKPERISDLRCILGRAAYARGQFERAGDLLTTSLALARGIDDPYAIGQALNALALINVDRGELASAVSAFGDALATWLALGWKDGIANCLAGVATLATTQRAWDVAARLFGAVSAMQIQVGPELRVERVRHARAEREAATLGGAAFAAAFEAGRALRSEDAIAEAAAYLSLASAETPSTQQSEAFPYGLSQRELDVLRQIAAGLSDREIADALFISRHTVMRHVSNILMKLAVGSRTAAAALAVRDGLV